MSFEVDPNATHRFFFNRSRPGEGQPALYMRHMSARETSHVEKLFEESRSLTKLTDVNAKILEALKIFVVKAEGFGRKVDVDSLDDVLSTAQLIVLRDESLAELTIDDLKKRRSEFSQRSTTDNSAS